MCAHLINVRQSLDLPGVYTMWDFKKIIIDISSSSISLGSAIYPGNDSAKEKNTWH